MNANQIIQQLNNLVFGQTGFIHSGLICRYSVLIKQCTKIERIWERGLSSFAELLCELWIMLGAIVLV